MEKIEWDRLCCNCSSFFRDCNDSDLDFGVCLMDEEFEPFVDKILVNSDFSVCRDLYMKKRRNAEHEVCEHYEEINDVEMTEEEFLEMYFEQMKYHNVDKIIKDLYDANTRVANKAITTISTYITMRNESAYEGLLKFYMGMGPAESLEDVYFRMQIINVLSSGRRDKDAIDAYIHELARTPSNHTTRQLYTEILRRLSSYPNEMIREPLLELIGKKQYSYKIKKRIMDIAIPPDPDEYWYRDED